LLDPATRVKASSKPDLMRMLAGLVIAGHLSDRVLVWPALDCSGSRIRRSPDRRHWTGVFDASVLPYGGPEDVKCLDLDLTWNYCFEVRLTLPWLP
jgi:hypothetical protein